MLFRSIRAGLAGVTGVTKIIIAQRVNSVMDADQIVILDDGRVHATGTHAELLAHEPIYQELYESQVGPATIADEGVVAPGPVGVAVGGGRDA